MEIRAKDSYGIEQKLVLEKGTVLKDLATAAGKAFNTSPESMKFIHRGKILRDGEDEIETKYKIRNGDKLLVYSKGNNQIQVKKNITETTLDTEPLSSNTNSQHQIDSLHEEDNVADDVLNDDPPNIQDAPQIIVPTVEDYDPSYNHIMMNSIPIYNMSRYTFLIDPTKVEQLLNLGFERNNIIECLRASNNNLEIAAEFCMNGIPRDDESDHEDNMEEEESENQTMLEPEQIPNQEILSNEENVMRPRNDFTSNHHFHLPNIQEDSMEDDITNLERAILNINNSLQQQIGGSSNLAHEEIDFLKSRTEEQKNVLKDFLKSEILLKLREEVKEDPQKLNVDMLINDYLEKENPALLAIFNETDLAKSFLESLVSEENDIEFKNKQALTLFYLGQSLIVENVAQNTNRSNSNNEDMIIEENEPQTANPLSELTPSISTNQMLLDLVQRTFNPTNVRSSNSTNQMQSNPNQNIQSNNQMSEENQESSHQNITTQEFNVSANIDNELNNNQEQDLNNNQEQSSSNNIVNGDPRLYALDPRDNIAIQNQVQFGFSYNQALEAYQSCNKNEEQAANFLFDNPTFGNA